MDLVVGIDSSTTATKAIAWDRGGNAVAEGRASIPMQTPASGFFEQDPADWWRSTCKALRDLGGHIDLGRVAGLAIANQRETIAVLGEDGEALRPGILWLDERCREDVRLLSDKLGSDYIRDVIGKTPDPTPGLYELHWIRRCEPEIHARIRRVVEVHGYLVRQLTGNWRTSWVSADPLGVYDLHHKRYAEGILAGVGLTPGHFAPAMAPGTVLGEVTTGAADATGLRAGTPIVAGGGDGQVSGLGVAVLGAGRAYLNLGTASVSGVWAKDYRTDPAWRTLTSASGEGYIYELCLRTGTFLTEWIVKGLFAGDASSYAALEAEAMLLPPGSEGLLLQPYWSGSMTPYWDQDARGTLLGLSSEHGRAHLYRAMMEGITLDAVMGLSRIEAVMGEPIHEIVAIGGGSRSDLWCRIVADASGRTVLRSATAEASSLGAGVCAAAGIGWYENPTEASLAMAGRIEARIEPDPARQARYGTLLGVYEKLYPALREAHATLAAFRREEPLH